MDGVLHDWPALQPAPDSAGTCARWADMAYLKSVAGVRTVPVEVGEHYLSDSHALELMTLERFIDHWLTGGASDCGYVAQHPLFDHIPSLRADVSVIP